VPVAAAACYAWLVLIDGPTFRRLVRGRELLESPAHDELTVRDVAARVALSPYHFIRRFAALFGDTPHQVRTRARVERAKLLLAAGITVTDACHEVGFSSLGSFSLLFCRRTGAPPSAYRRQVAVPRSFGAPPVPGCLGLIAQVPPGAWSNSREARVV
jgi:AraC-like DNA-binding protein